MWLWQACRQLHSGSYDVVMVGMQAVTFRPLRSCYGRHSGSYIQAPRMWLWQACRQFPSGSYILSLAMNVVVAVKHLP